MEDDYQYPVFFECANLTAEKKRKIEKYFTIKRKSGGGECGLVININQNVHSIAFKDREAQQRVLTKSKHELEIESGRLVLNVRDSPGPSSPSPDQPVKPTVDSASQQKQEKHAAASTLSPRDKEYELPADVYLLRYLMEYPKVWAEVQEKLASLACSGQLCPEKERVLVKRLAIPDAAPKGRNWTAEVDKIFNCYTCHYEIMPQKVKALLQACKSQTFDDVKVYSDIGMAVVVGEHSQVSIVLSYLENICDKLRGSPSEIQTSTCRLGEAKLRLLWKEIKDSVRQLFPGVKVTKGDAGQLDLAGSVGEILKTRKLISDKEKLVLERTLSNKSPLLLAFIRKVYGGPGTLSNFLGVGDEVEVELRDTEVQFLSLSAEKLNYAEKQMQKKFKEEKVDFSTCSVVSSELKETLKTKTNEMNERQCRVQAEFSSDNTVFLLGHAKEVEVLSETISQFILDQAKIEGKVSLPFPELIQLLPEFLNLHNFDHSGVNFRPLTCSSGPFVLIEGPAGKVTEVRSLLGPFLNSLGKQMVTVDLPGAISYFGSHLGRDCLLSVGQSHKYLIKLEKQLHSSRQGSELAKYSLGDEIQVIVCEGDITKQCADALVNAANEDLSHGGGVAEALSEAAGPEMQNECRAIVKRTGKVPTGTVVVSTGGNLKCKKLLHAVGPVGGKSVNRETDLLKKTVHAALNMAELMEFQSIAMPCISSGLFGVPLPVCSEAIVSAVKEFGCQGGRSLKRIILIDNRQKVVRALQETCDRLLQGASARGSQQVTSATSTDSGIQLPAANQDTAGAAAGATTGTPGGGVRVDIIQGTIETQQVDAMVSPMVGHDPLSTRVGNALSSVAGNQLTAKFHKEAGGATLPGDIVLVENSSFLKAKAVIFLNQLCWDNNQNGTAAQVLRNGIQKILASCQIRGFTSVALPVLGTGAMLHFPHTMASKIILEEVAKFEQTRVSSSSFLVRIVIHPSDKQSNKAFQSAQKALHLRGFTTDANLDQASFYRHVCSTDDEVTAMMGQVKLQMVYGDITKERTDVIVNTTDFSNRQGVSKAILTAAGPVVQAELAQVGIPATKMCTTVPGMLGCREIIHATFQNDAQIILKNCQKILKECESKGYSSVSFPAINTGMGGLNYATACKAMLDGFVSAITQLKPKSLLLIRIVIFQQAVFQDFKSELENRFGQTVSSRIPLKEKAKKMLQKFQRLHSKLSPPSASHTKSLISLKPQPAVFSVIGRSPIITHTIQADLEDLLKKQLVEREVDVHHISRLDTMELDAVQAKVRLLGISLEHRRCQSSENGNAARSAARDRSGKEVYVLKGLKEDVLTVQDLINRSIQNALCKDLQDKEEAMLALTVQWSVKDVNGEWQEVSLHENYMLEEAHSTNQLSVDIKAPDGMIVKINLKTQEATNPVTGMTHKVKRSKSEAALELPTHWEPMGDELFKKAELKPNSKEYQDIAQGFLKTAKYNIQKIERVQNLYLWRAYSVCKQRILAKNGAAQLGEKFLYHGTSAESCNCIEKDRFDRSYAGTHAAVYGKGVYFAVDAKYSAAGYSPPDASGLKRLYVTHVLTGRYTAGNSSLKAPPPRGSDRTDCFDSVVDNVQQPTMFVVFHDDQAYPEYLITFR
ncbi:protein mono-ADP-ribosyltransferase PARP14-like [Pholidichthys leucotaenia]